MPRRRRSITRRGFLAAGAAALAGAALPARALRAQEPPAAEVPARPVSVPEAPVLPPPVPAAEYTARQAATREKMGAFIDALILPPGPSLHYLTGLTLARRERIVAYLMLREGESVVLCSEHEREAVAEAPVPVGRIEVWSEEDVPVDVVKKILRRADLNGKRIALGSSLWYDEMALLHNAVPSLEFVSAGSILDPLRESKSEAEAAILRAASRIVERAIALSWADVREGMTERDLAALVEDRIADMGGAPSGRVLSGVRTALRRAATTDRAFAAGDPVVIDYHARLHGYWGRAARTAVLGRPSGRMTLIWSMITDARSRALEAAEPGLAASALYQRARGTLGSRGMGKYVPDRLGQGIGLEQEESPWFSAAGGMRLAAGNVATFEPGLDTPGEYGLRAVDLIEISAAGGRYVTDPPDTLTAL